MSGLLVKSTVVMKENLEEMNARGVAERYPVLLGGAALTRAYVEHDLAEVFEGEVRYARDAFEGLRLMDAVMAGKRGDSTRRPTPPRRRKAAERKARHERSAADRRGAQGAAEAEDAGPIPARSDVALDNPVPTPPFWGTRVVKGIALADYAALLDERATFMGQWGLRGATRRQRARYEELVETEGRPRLRYWLDRLQTEQVLRGRRRLRLLPVRVRGRRPGRARRAAIDAPERGPVHLPAAAPGPAPVPGRLLPAPRVAGRGRRASRFTVVTMGQRIADFANELFAANAYRDYLELHGLSVQLTEALAEYWHPRIRAELRFADGVTAAAEDPTTSRSSSSSATAARATRFGYPACPDLEDRTKLRRRCWSPARIGVELSEEFQLHPEQSTRRWSCTTPRRSTSRPGERPRRAENGATRTRRRAVRHGRHAGRLRAALGRRDGPGRRAPRRQPVAPRSRPPPPVSRSRSR